MVEQAPSLTSEKIVGVLVCALAGALAIVAGYLMGNDPQAGFVLVLLCVGMGPWLVFGYKSWWALVPSSMAMGGYFDAGFKIYPNEMALLFCMVPLLPALALHWSHLRQRREPMLLAVKLLLAYFLIHIVASIIYNRLIGQGGTGNVVRAYMNGLWVIIFLIAFHIWGSTRYVRIVLQLYYVFSLMRVFFGLLAVFTGSDFEVPLIHYIPPGSTNSSGGDLRFGAVQLALAALTWFSLSRSRVAKSLHLACFGFAGLALLFGGSRGSLAIYFLVAVAYLAINGRTLALTALGAVGFTTVLYLNLNHTILYEFHPTAARTLSIVVLNKEISEEYGSASSSDKWHSDLRVKGYEKWTQNLGTFIFGTGIRPYDPASAEFRAGVTMWEHQIDAAAKIGAYESAFWTVTAVMGITGLGLYLNIFVKLARELIPRLWNRKLDDATDGFAFLFLASIFVWALMSWTVGGMPNAELLFGLIALDGYRDRERKASARHEEDVLTGAPALPTHLRPLSRPSLALRPR